MGDLYYAGFVWSLDFLGMVGGVGQHVRAGSPETTAPRGCGWIRNRAGSFVIRLLVLGVKGRFSTTCHRSDVGNVDSELRFCDWATDFDLKEEYNCQSSAFLSLEDAPMALEQAEMGNGESATAVLQPTSVESNQKTLSWSKTSSTVEKSLRHQ